jgi:cleavage stimulation factor subunit 3
VAENNIQSGTMDALRRAIDGGSREQIIASYRSLLEQFPTSGALWTAFCQYLCSIRAVADLEKAFASSLRTVLDVRLWKIYLQHVVTVNAHADATDPAVMLQAFEFAVNSVGLDIESFPIWRAYTDVLKALPGLEPSQRTDLLRKAYARVLQIPIEGLEILWGEYDTFEQSTNRMTAKKMISDKSTAYMTARGHIKTLHDLSVLSLDRHCMPAVANDDVEAAEMAGNWLRWIAWEKGNPLSADKATVNQRVMFAYRKALMTQRGQPVIWLSMVDFCEEQMIAISNTPWFGRPSGTDDVGVSLLKQATEANPTSVSLALALTERLELDKKRADLNKETIKGLYEGLVSAIEAKLQDVPDYASMLSDPQHLQAAGRLSQAYVHWMSYVRRGEGLAAARAIFTRARKHHLCGPAVYAASAWMEYWHGAKDKVLIASRIFDLGMSKFATWSGDYVLEYATFLQGIKDDTNLRAMLEKALVQLGKDRNLPLWKFYLRHEAVCGGDVASLKHLEKRMFDQHPSVTYLDVFQLRHETMNMNVLEGASALQIAQKPLDVNSLSPRNLAIIPGGLPDLVLQFLMRLNGLAYQYDGPTVDFAIVSDLLSKYPPPVPVSAAASSSSRVQAPSSSHSSSRSLVEKGDRDKPRSSRSTYDDVFEDESKRRRRK